MTNPRIVLIALTLIVSASASSFFTYPENFPIVYFTDFKYVPTNYGYLLAYKTRLGVYHEEQGVVPGVTSARNANGIPNPDVLGSSRQGREKLPLKNRKVSPKLLSSLSG